MTADDIRAGLEQMAEYGTPQLGIASLVDVGTKPFLDFFAREVLDDLVGVGGATCRFFEGAYGSGKTHLLLLLQELALNLGMAVVRTELSHALKLEEWRDITKYVLGEVEVQIQGRMFKSLPKILEALHECGCANPKSLANANLPHPGFQAAMLRMVKEPCHGQARNLLSRYLLGEKVSAKKFRDVGITGIKNPLSQRNAECVLNTVTAGLFYVGLPGTMLLFDETEQSLQHRPGAPSKRVRMAANLIRRLIDGCNHGGLTGVVAVFAVLPEFLGNCASAYPALGQRLSMVRDKRFQPAWRWPVLPVGAISAVGEPEAFLQEVISKFEQLVAMCGGSTQGLRSQMEQGGQKVLKQNASSGYRRDLMRLLANLALERVREGQRPWTSLRYLSS